MSRWYLDENDKDIYFRDDKGIRWDYNLKEIVSILNGQEEKLKNVIISKFKINEDVYIIWHGMIIDVEIKAIGKDEYYVDTCHFDLAEGWGGIFVDKDEVFKTKEEAESKLKEFKDD